MANRLLIIADGLNVRIAYESDSPEALPEDELRTILAGIHSLSFRAHELMDQIGQPIDPFIFSIMNSDLGRRGMT